MGRHVVARATAAIVAIAGFAGTASAVIFGLDNITTNNAGDVAIGKAQIQLEATSPNAGQVLFTFSNVGSQPAVIEQVFFERSPAASLAAIMESTGVSFSQDKKPGNLPGGNSLSPQFQEVFSASADSPAPFNGVNNTLDGSQTLGLLFNLACGKTFDDVLTQMGNGSFRVGLHVIAFASGGSESFINDSSPRPVPLPQTAALLLAGVPMVLRRRQWR